MDAETARSVWRIEPGEKGFWHGVIGLAVALGSACNLPHILVVTHGGSVWMKTLVIGLPIVLAGLATGALLRRPEEWRRILMALMCVLFVQFAGLTACFWHQWSQTGAWQAFIAIIAIQSLSLGVWLVTIIISYLYWRWEKWGRPLSPPPE